MKFEDLVKKYEDTKFQIKRIDLKVKEMRLLYGFPQAIKYDSQPTAKSTNSSVESALIKLDDLLQEKSKYEQILGDLRAKIQSAIDSLDNYSMREIIELKVFTSNCGWKYISNKVYLSKSYCRKLFHIGVEVINKKYFTS